MSQEPFPGRGQDGEEPQPESGAGNESWDAGNVPADDFDEDAYLDRFAADVDAGRIPIPADDAPVQGLTIHLAEVTDPAAADTAGFTKGGPADTMDPGAALSALAEAAAATLGTLTSNQILGVAGAGRRLAALGTWIELGAAAEFAARNRTGNPQACVAREMLTEFAGDELAPELKMTPFAAAEHLSYAHTVTKRLPATFAALHTGAIDAYRVKIVAEATQWLSDSGAAEADQILSVSAAQLTYGRLRNAAARLVMMLDPDAAKRRKDEASRNARVNFFREEAGTAGLSGRDLPVDGTFASYANVKAKAAAYKAAGILGTITELRARAFLDLLQEKDARDAISGESAASAAGAAGTADQTADEYVGSVGQDEDPPGGDDLASQDDDNGADPGGTGGTGPRPAPSAPPGPGGGARTHGQTPLAALINITVPLATLLGSAGASGEAAGFGLLDPEAARDLAAAASTHPATRWCVTVTGPDGTAAAHGCVPGQHPYDPSQYPTSEGTNRNRDGPGTCRDGPSAPEDTQRAADFLRRLKVKLAPIARGDCDHASYEPGYRPSRRLKHLIRARTARCHFYGCSRPAAECDADHTVPWPAGPTCQCNLGPPCRHHHRCKQDPGWKLEQPEPGIMVWTGPSGRQHTTRPTAYLA